MTYMVGRFIVSGDATPGRDRPDSPATSPARPLDRLPTGVTPVGDAQSGLSTVGSGKPSELVDEQPPKEDEPPDIAHDDIARQALAQARKFTANTRGSRKARDRRGRQRSSKDPSAGGYSGARPDDRDPQAMGVLLEGLVDERGWNRPLAEARVFADWSTLVGADIASHCRPTDLKAGELRITAESTAWATQLQLIASALLASLARQLGPEVVRKVVITGPTGPSWKHGGWSVRGARGPRDTYG